MDRIELTIFRNLVNNQSFLQKAFPFLKSEYFQSATDRVVFDHISKYVSTYNSNPTISKDMVVTDNSFVPSPVLKLSRMEVIKLNRLPCVTITPLGLPVEPDVYNT